MKKHWSVILVLAILFGAVGLSANTKDKKESKRDKKSKTTQIVFARKSLSEIQSQLAKSGVKIQVSSDVADKTVSIKLQKDTPENMVKELCKAARVKYYADPKTKTFQIVSNSEFRKWEREQRRANKKSKKSKKKK